MIGAMVPSRPMRGRRNTREDILARFDEVDGHWIWRGSVNADGYGHVKFEGRTWRAHRLVRLLVVGDDGGDLDLDHSCQVRLCVRPHPDHVVPRTHAENMEGVDCHDVGATNRAKVACPLGHAYDETNTYVSASGDRHCRPCRRDNQARYLARRAA